MSKSAKTGLNLPPRHSGYRAAATGRYVVKSAAKALPKPSNGDAGGSKPQKASS